MIRYYLYLIVMNMIVNVIVFVPSILIKQRFDGTVMAIIIGIPFSLILLYFYSNAMFTFPELGLPEILFKHTKKWFSIMLLLFLAGLTFYGGWTLLMAFINIVQRFINPEMSKLFTTTLFLMVIGMGVLLKTEKVLYAVELILFFSLPLIFLIFLKSYTNEYLSWDAIRVVLTHYYAFPSWSTFGATCYTLSGFSYVIIYNRAFKGEIKKIRFWWLLLIGMVAFINAFTSVFIPIGFNGSIGVEDYIYPWITTADSMRMEFGFIERVLFIMLLMYISISLMMVIVIWHVGLELLKSLIPAKKTKKQRISLLSYGIFSLFAIMTYFSTFTINMRILKEITNFYYILLIPVGVFLTILLSWIARKKKYEENMG